MLRCQAIGGLAPSLIMNDILNYTLLCRCVLIDCFARQYILPAVLNVCIRLANPVTTFYLPWHSFTTYSKHSAFPWSKEINWSRLKGITRVVNLLVESFFVIMCMVSCIKKFAKYSQSICECSYRVLKTFIAHDFGMYCYVNTTAY